VNVSERMSVRVVRAGERVQAEAQTPGMFRTEAFASEGLWAGTVTTLPGLITGWHHHGDFDSYIYVLSGTLRIEYGPGGTLAAEAGPGDFVSIPQGAIHREGSERGSAGVEAVIFRVGSGPPAVNMEGPEEG
jgi:uncharacterized RmlC-like cupin family protein